ncbi:MIP/aquaporin family protein [Listeria booriae]|uniref:Aquaporin family protein n=1 Tax=Listeria booriae TaxID=1552123 RepID=A0A7X0XL79_9LIST|nr:MIP/aquaporin family protein [Listeria booriae]MBC1226649.1 aquaporin family protein [Listeria booriae]MBC1230085.1 aquaporin family protein [Listeria booriae]MBC1511663.1 aquaporin family protein [Listeria booriae]MBC1563060.1 aquaporin family protein [Listeria booriae]MBC1573216.1 aquaporin family protein [Listeria booriae]
MDTSIGTQFLGELLGTMILVLFGGGVVAGVSLKQSKAEAGGWVVVTLAWGLAVTMGVYVSGYMSLAHLNPAVTIGMALAGKFPWADVFPYISAQFIGAFLGATLVWLHYFPHWAKTEDKPTKLGVFSTAPAIRHYTSNFFGEALGTFILIFGLLSIGANKFSEGLNPLVVGGLIVVIGMSLGGTTGYAINPARDLGPRIAHFVWPISGKGGSDWAYSWVPVLGPIVGGALGGLGYNAVINGDFNVWLWIFIALFLVILLGTMQLDKKQKA